MGRHIQAVVLIVAGVGAIATQASAQDERKKDRKESILAALKQCGDSCHSVARSGASDSEIPLDTARAVRMIVETGKGDLSTKFPQAAVTIAEKYPTGILSIGFYPPDNFTLPQLQAVLGMPDKVTKEAVNNAGNSINVAWQWYDWCAFGVGDDEKIIWLAADLKKVKMKEKKK